jgi:hypothetical protein
MKASFEMCVSEMSGTDEAVFDGYWIGLDWSKGDSVKPENGEGCGAKTFWRGNLCAVLPRLVILAAFSAFSAFFPPSPITRSFSRC